MLELAVVDNIQQRPPSATAAPSPVRAWALFPELLSLANAHAHAVEVGWSSKKERRELETRGSESDKNINLSLLSSPPLSNSKRR